MIRGQDLHNERLYQPDHITEVLADMRRGFVRYFQFFSPNIASLFQPHAHPVPTLCSGLAAPPKRAGLDISTISDEVIQHMQSLVGSAVTLTLEIEARLPDGAPDNVVRTVTENARTLKFSQFGFEED